MTTKESGRLILLSGPSCVGKTPLKKAFYRVYGQDTATLLPVVAYTSRERRPNEKEGLDYFFRSRQEIEKMSDNPGFLQITVHDDLQLLDIHGIKEMIAQNDVLYEGNTVVSRKIQSDRRLRDIDIISIFLSPLKGSEIRELLHRGADFFESIYIKLIRQKLLRREKRYKRPLTRQRLADLKKRADDAFKELTNAHYYDYIIPNHDGEDSDHWDNPAFPEGDAGQALAAFYAILKGNHHPLIEHWDEDIVSWRV